MDEYIKEVGNSLEIDFLSDVGNGIFLSNGEREVLDRYNIDYKGWRLEGDFLRWNYDVYEQSRLVAHISKQLFRWGDTYVLDIANDADELPALMVAIAMDAAKCSEDDNRNSMI